MLLEKIKTVDNIKSFSISELEVLAQEVRKAILNKVSQIGGHVGSNLGITELTIALHYVFQSPLDKFVFDVSHQSYPHKILTNRYEGFLDAQQFDKVSGYSSPAESEHDYFTIGHTSTSISLATGLAKGRDLKQEHWNAIAIIGDGSLSGGEALEGLDFAGEMRSNLIIIVNDNQMSIAENHGGLYKNLEQLRQSKGTAALNLFRSLGLDYIWGGDGNDLAHTIDILQQVKDIDHPVVVHFVTEKGKGFEPAVTEKETWHYTGPFLLPTGEPRYTSTQENYEDITSDYLLHKMHADKQVCTIVAGTPCVLNFTEEKRKQAGEQFVDVGIAEEHAIAMASGMTKSGGKPVVAIYSTFVQRCYDQIAQDMCINQSPVTILVALGGAQTMNDVTHTCLYDIPLLSNIPNLIYLAPTSLEEYLAMLDWSIEQTKYPVAIRIPTDGVRHTEVIADADYNEINLFQVTQTGQRNAIIAAGSFFHLGQEVALEYFKRTGVAPTVINPRYLSGIDTTLLELLKKNHEVVLTLEDGETDGGFGEKIARFYSQTDMKVIVHGIQKGFYDRFDANELYQANGLTVSQLVEELLAIREGQDE